jgi:hypothetical protein
VAKRDGHGGVKMRGFVLGWSMGMLQTYAVSVWRGCGLGSLRIMLVAILATALADFWWDRSGSPRTRRGPLSYLVDKIGAIPQIRKRTYREIESNSRLFFIALTRNLLHYAVNWLITLSFSAR